MSADLSTAPALLAFDTAIDVVHVGLTVRHGVWSVSIPGQAKSSETLLPAIHDLLAQAGIELSQLDAIGFGRGPGAFTGLRTACAVAQGMALGLDVPLIAIDTLGAVAQDALQSGAQGRIWAVQDARMGQLYAAAYEVGATGLSLHSVEGPFLWTPDQLVAHLTPAVARDKGLHLAGNALGAYPEELASLNVKKWPQACPSGTALVALSVRQWHEGATLDPAMALPLYVRDKVAQTTAERMAAKAQPEAR